MNSPYAEDWANLSRYQKENAKLEMPKPSQPRIVFMGDSITEGWINKRPDFFSDNAYVNRGISGQTTPQMLLRFRQDVINLKPSAVVILGGINDIAGNTGHSTIEMIVNNIVSMVEISKANHIKVILCSVLPANHIPWQIGLEPAEKIIELNTLLKNYANQHNLIYVDYFTPMADKGNGLKEKFGSDSVHPNISGYLIMEPLIKEAISKVFFQNKPQ